MSANVVWASALCVGSVPQGELRRPAHGYVVAYVTLGELANMGVSVDHGRHADLLYQRKFRSSNRCGRCGPSTSSRVSAVQAWTSNAEREQPTR